MLEFKIPELSDKIWVDEILSKTKCKNCDLCFGNIYIWASVYNTRIARFNDSLIIRSKVDGEYTYTFSYAGNGIVDIVNELLENANKHNQILQIYSLSCEEKEVIEKELPGKFDISEMRDFADYVYNTDNLINLAGRKYHQKRNHISYFKNSHEWSYETINDSNIEECRLFNKQWERHNSNKNPDELEKEDYAIQIALDNFKELGFVGGLLKVDGKIEAYTLGEPLSSDMFCTHIEKANADMRGAYPMINQQFAVNELSGYKYINREEDTGSEGLRQAKLTYHPAFLIESYYARYKK